MPILSEWRVKYQFRAARSQDEAISFAIMAAKRDVPDAHVTVLYTWQTPSGRWNVEVLRKRGI